MMFITILDSLYMYQNYVGIFKTFFKLYFYRGQSVTANDEVAI